LKHSSLDVSPTAHLHKLLYAEETCVKASLREYDMENAQFTVGSFGLMRLHVPGLSEKRPSVLVDDMIEAVADGTCHQGYVHYVHHDDIDVSFHHHVQPGKTYAIHFTCKRTDFRLLHRAVNRTMDLHRPLLTAGDTQPDDAVVPDVIHPSPLRDLNHFQKQFVEESARSKERLRLLWGPPGTGKTTTVVAYIAALVLGAVQRISVLVVTPSNGASNLIVSKLLVALQRDNRRCEKKILRVVAASRSPDEVPTDVRTCCCIHDVFDSNQGKTIEGFRAPTRDEVDQASVVVVTLGSCGRLFGMHPDLAFTHVVVDEGGQATEPELAAALQFDGSPRVVIAGDPKQLGPITVSMAARAKGMDRSPLVRLIECENAKTTMLNECYRCHPSVLAAFNPVFYDGKLVSGDPRSVKFSTNATIPGFSEARVKWVHCRRAESYDRQSPSIMNVHEACEVVQEFKRLVDAGVSRDDIVILAPYALQVKKIREMLRLPPTQLVDKTWLSNHVTSVEAFQGREARVVILSCVRSPEHETESAELLAADARRQLGFLSQPQRSNVSLSRAIDGMVVIGNLLLLANDSRVWGRVLASMLLQVPPHARCDGMNVVERTKLMALLRTIHTVGGAPLPGIRPLDAVLTTDDLIADTSELGIHRTEE
jgi:DNA polymerase III delta prime subunit